MTGATPGTSPWSATEAAAAAPLLRLPTELAPSTALELNTYINEMFDSGAIEVTPAAKGMAEALLSPDFGPASRLFGMARLATLGLLPPAIREGYGFDWSDRQARRFVRLTSLIRRTRSLAPPIVREWPAARKEVRLEPR